MTDSDFRHRRQQLLDRFLSGEIDQSSYDRMLGQLEQIESDPAPPRPTESPKTDTESSQAQDRTAHMSIGDQDTVAPAASALQAGIEVGGYKLLSQLGRGGMGEVWKARDNVGQRDVVVKVLPPELQNSQDEMDRVRDVFHRVHALQHQHICPIYQLGQDPRVGYYLVMKFVEGSTLSRYRRDYLSSHEGFPLAEAIRVLAPTAAALDYAHGQKVVHRDVKPQNIMISPRGDDPQLVDFGLAAEIRMSVTRISRVEMETSGTYPYMAPEQWKGEFQDGRTDQYALAVVAYELLCGQTPFHTPDALVLRQCVLSEKVPEIAGQPSHVNEALSKAMAKSRGDRFESCSAFVEAMREQLTRPIRPPRPSAVGSGQMKSDIALELKEATAALRQSGDLRSFLQRVAATRMTHWRMAARQGIAGGQWLLGKCFEHGICVDKSMPEAIDLYRQAAKRGEPVAQVTLGNCFLRGRGVPQNSSQAVTWFRKAARKGDAFAATALGRCYLHGEGVPVNPKEALKYLNKAAQLGHPPAQVELGVCYAEGIHVPPDLQQSQTWLKLAADQGNQKAQQWLNHLETRKAAGAPTHEATRLLAEPGTEGAPPVASDEGALTDVESELTRKEDIMPAASGTVANTVAPGQPADSAGSNYDSHPSWRSDSQIVSPTRNWLVPAVSAGIAAILLTLFAVGGAYLVVKGLTEDNPTGQGEGEDSDPNGGNETLPNGTNEDAPQGIIQRTEDDPSDSGTGEEGTGSDGTGEEGTGEEGTGPETGDDGTGDSTDETDTGDDSTHEGTGDDSAGDDGTGDDGTGDDTSEEPGPGDSSDDTTEVIPGGEDSGEEETGGDEGNGQSHFIPGGPANLPAPRYTSLDYIRDDLQIIAGSAEGVVAFDAISGEEIGSIGTVVGGVDDVTVSPSTYIFGVAGREDEDDDSDPFALRFYMLPNPNVEPEEGEEEDDTIDLVELHGHDVRSLAVDFSMNTLEILSGDSEGGILFTDGYEGKQLGYMLVPDTRVLATELVRGDFLGVTAHDDGIIRVWDLYEKKIIRRFEGHEGPVYDVTVDRERDICISTGADGTVRVWDFEPSRTSWHDYDGADLLATLEGHTAPVTGVVVSYDGKYAFTSSLDGTVRVWSTASGRELERFEAECQLSDVAIDLLTQHVAASGDKIYVWDLPEVYHIDPNDY